MAVAADGGPSTGGADGTTVSLHWPKISKDLVRAEALVATNRLDCSPTIHKLLLLLSWDFCSHPDHHLEEREGENPLE